MNSSAPVWASGPLSFHLDPATGFVRWIRWHGHEALRGIYPAVRDEHWATLASDVAPPRVDASPTSLRLRLSGRIRAGAELDWEADIAAEPGCWLTNPRYPAVASPNPRNTEAASASGHQPRGGRRRSAMRRRRVSR